MDVCFMKSCGIDIICDKLAVFSDYLFCMKMPLALLSTDKIYLTKFKLATSLLSSNMFIIWMFCHCIDTLKRVTCAGNLFYPPY
ncbi:hypothetical protein DW103_03480 [Parabacteroides sp. AM08-6]|nr:hypothetical protein DW103_03480 [Parabacteroides sp. AM08-6]